MEPAPQTISITVQVPVTNLTAEAIEAAVIARVLAAVLPTQGEAYDEQTGESYTRFDPSYINKMRATADAKMAALVEQLVAKNGEAFVADILNGEFQPMTAWGERSGPPTTIRHMVYQHARSWIDGEVQENGQEIRGYYNGTKVKRLHWLIHAEVQKFFAAEAKEVVAKIAAEVKPLIAGQLSAAVTETVGRLLGVSK